MRFGDWNFRDDFGRAENVENRSVVEFTIAEARLIDALQSNRGRVVSRDRLLDAIHGSGVHVNDRNIDFVVNRVRKKLGDQPRKPTFIATKYGGGYVWVATPGDTAPAILPKIILVGPVISLDGSGDLDPAAEDFLSALCTALDDKTSSGVDVRHGDMSPDDPPAQRRAPDFSVSLTFLEENGDKDAAVTLYRWPSDRVLEAFRVNGIGLDDMSAGDVAQKVLEALWRHLVFTSPSLPEDSPLAVRIHEGATFLTGQEAPAEASEAKLRADTGDGQESARDAILLATGIHSKWILEGVRLLRSGLADYRRDRADIRALVRAALPEIEDDPVLALTAAKLLRFASDSNNEAARVLGDTAMRRTTAIAAALPTYGQLHFWYGNVDRALELFDRALRLTRFGTHGYGYVQVLRTQTLSAMRRYHEADEAAILLCRNDPPVAGIVRVAYGCTLPDDHAERGETALSGLDPVGARALLLHLHCMTGRFLMSDDLRRGLYTRPARQLRDRFGPEVIPRRMREVLGDA